MELKAILLPNGKYCNVGLFLNKEHFDAMLFNNTDLWFWKKKKKFCVSHLVYCIIFLSGEMDTGSHGWRD